MKCIHLWIAVKTYISFSSGMCEVTTSLWNEESIEENAVIELVIPNREHASRLEANDLFGNFMIIFILRVQVQFSIVELQKGLDTNDQRVFHFELNPNQKKNKQTSKLNQIVLDLMELREFMVNRLATHRDWSQHIAFGSFFLLSFFTVVCCMFWPQSATHYIIAKELIKPNGFWILNAITRQRRIISWKFPNKTSET